MLFEVRKARFLLVGAVNAHHQEWLGISTANLHGRAARDFAYRRVVCRWFRRLHILMEGCLSWW